MNKKAFTLIELLVGIALITIIFIGASNISFKSSTDRQKLEIFTNRIISAVETARSNNLIGRGILSGANLVTPDRWIINVSSNGQGYVRTNYQIGTSTPVLIGEVIFEKGYKINNISCVRPNGTSNNLTNSQIGQIIFEKGKYSLGTTCLANSTQLKIEISYNDSDSVIIFDAINGLIKKD